MKNETRFEKAKKEYNDIMYSEALEHLTIGDERFSEGTENWNLRDMVSEMQYQLDICYEEGNANNEGQHMDIWELTPDVLMSKEKFRYYNNHNESEIELHEHWLKKTKTLRNFINKYKKYCTEMSCTQGHCSCFD